MNEDIILIVIGILFVVVLIGVISKRIIFFDSEKDLYSNISFFFWGLCFGGVMSLYPDLATYSLIQKIFFWLGAIIFGAVALGCLAQTLTASIKGNGIVLGIFMFIFKLLFTLIMIIFILGKISEMFDDDKKKGNIVVILAVFALLKVFWKPLKNFFINGDRVREKRGELMRVEPEINA
tara:strand:+ start:273 stop:809 length:537 start_codon:yes stop_codon:yes gene_type:complete